MSQTTQQTMHRSIEIDGLDIFYREAGPTDAPTVLLLHGFPTSSHMFRNLIPRLSDRFHLVAPDYPGYGASAMPDLKDFDYSFDNLAEVVDRFVETIGLERYSIYLMDYGAPVGYRLAAKHPERVDSLCAGSAGTGERALRVSVDAALRAGIFKASGSIDPIGFGDERERGLPRPWSSSR